MMGIAEKRSTHPTNTNSKHQTSIAVSNIFAPNTPPTLGFNKLSPARRMGGALFCDEVALGHTPSIVSPPMIGIAAFSIPAAPPTLRHPTKYNPMSNSS
jgi:hypothetical protein